jgi:TFIIF-interacting CTD phosphatase-like protein
MDIKKMMRTYHRTASKVISIRISPEDYDFMRNKNLQPSKIISECLKELRKKWENKDGK